MASQELAIRRQEIFRNLASVRQRIEAIVGGKREARLVAISKLKPISDIRIAYEDGQRHFGENYAQELVEKSKELPLDIQWHFVGPLQSNKCKMLAAIPNLWAVETIDSQSKADLMNKACASRESPLRIFVQVNTSKEESKSGVPPEECITILNHVQGNCPKLQLAGLMTIGAPNRDPKEPNPDFITLKNLQTQFQETSGIELELSMGMSDDFEEALKLGATSVRVGSAIFGERPPKH
ncbi:YggS family pyridoxal phosphate enzyme [Gigaspora margarita]|uniref:Pyridoxal phosphate homeostasis protein n=1 Tax=Gigaspora margarita TaxID=4874 RepID=A0A8H4A7J0_GIGMA|nr:YggS family pyridoxal phosphate enzyme [Gigaspora margarita]